MNLEERTYSSHVFRPKPEVFVDDNGLVIVATPWGPRNCAKKAIQSIQDYYLTARGDQEATSPFEYLQCLSPAANDLRVAIMLANDKVYKEFNRKEYIAGVELNVFAKVENEINWAQIGHPNIFLSRKGKDLIALGSQIDLSENVLSAETISSPLPNNVIGIFETSHFTINSFRAHQDDELLMMSRSHLPKEIFAQDSDQRSLDDFVRVLTEDNEEMPFWLAKISF